MFLRRLAIAGLTVGLVAAIVSLFVDTGDHPSNASTTELADGILLDAGSGIAPIEDVVAFFRERADRRPNDHVSRTQLATALSTQARQTADLALYEEAEMAARDALRIKPDSHAASIELAAALHSQHAFGEALELGQRLLDEDPKSTDALYTVADAHFELGNYALARDGFTRLDRAGRNAATLSRLARLASIDGDNDRAVQLAAEALDASRKFSLRPNGAAFYPFQLGHFQFEAGDVDGAIESIGRALEIDPEHVGATEKLAGIYAAIGRTDDAAALYERLIAEGPAADIHGSYADLLRSVGDDIAAATQERLAAVLAAETIDDFPAERRHLAGYFVERDPELAVELARLDLVERRDVGAFDTLAWALHRSGRSAEAADVMADALAVGTNTASLRYHAGAIAAANGDTDAAIEHLGAALDINPTFALGDADDARTLLAELTG